MYVRAVAVCIPHEACNSQHPGFGRWKTDRKNPEAPWDRLAASTLSPVVHSVAITDRSRMSEGGSANSQSADFSPRTSRLDVIRRTALACSVSIHLPCRDRALHAQSGNSGSATSLPSYGSTYRAVSRSEPGVVGSDAFVVVIRAVGDSAISLLHEVVTTPTTTASAAIQDPSLMSQGYDRNEITETG